MNTTDTNPSTTTFFVTIQEKNLINLGIDIVLEDPEYMASQIEQSLGTLNCDFGGAIAISPSGVFHCHAALCFPTAKRLNTVSKLLGCSHTEVMAGSRKEAEDYIKKQGKYAEKGEKILKVFGSFDKIKDNKGKRTDIEAFDLAIKQKDFNLDKWITNNCKAFNRNKFFEDRLNRLLRQNVPKERDITVIYVEGKPRSGKTGIACQCFENFFKYNIDPKAQFPMHGYLYQKYLILDELREDTIPFELLMQYLDGYDLTIDVKGSSVKANWDIVIITTAFPLDQWFLGESGPDNKREQFLERITEHYITRRFKDFSMWIEYEDKDLSDEEILSLYKDNPYKRYYTKKQAENRLKRTHVSDNKEETVFNETGGNEPSSEVENKFILPFNDTDKEKIITDLPFAEVPNQYYPIRDNDQPIYNEEDNPTDEEDDEEDSLPDFVKEARMKILLQPKVLKALTVDNPDLNFSDCDVFPYDVGIAVPTFLIKQCLSSNHGKMSLRNIFNRNITQIE